jgi:tetratricopeptide (TPR) repeat protein
MGFEDRVAILEHTVRLDPGYVDAVYELANEIYTAGSGASSAYGTQRAVRLLNDFLNINANQQKILSLLARIYLQSKYTLKAHEIYRKLADFNPDSAENHYNLGVANYQLKNYDRAEQNFLRALEISDHLESYLYLGAICRHRENYDKALYYFRERIRRKTGDKDHYAKEAMRQVRTILEIISDSLNQENPDEVQTPGN